MDRLLIRAWIQPDHRRRLRVMVRTAPETKNEQQRAFADADSAAAFIRDWLLELPHRWERGEHTEPIVQSHAEAEGDSSHEQQLEEGNAK
jgi:hypothetical protein